MKVITKAPNIRRQDITILPADNPKKLRLGWVVYEEMGFAHVNEDAMRRIGCWNDDEENFDVVYESLRDYIGKYK